MRVVGSGRRSGQEEGPTRSREFRSRGGPQGEESWRSGTCLECEGRERGSCSSVRGEGPGKGKDGPTTRSTLSREWGRNEIRGTGV